MPTEFSQWPAGKRFLYGFLQGFGGHYGGQLPSPYEMELSEVRRKRLEQLMAQEEAERGWAERESPISIVTEPEQAITEEDLLTGGRRKDVLRPEQRRRITYGELGRIPGVALKQLLPREPEEAEYQLMKTDRGVVRLPKRGAAGLIPGTEPIEKPTEPKTPTPPYKVTQSLRGGMMQDFVWNAKTGQHDIPYGAPYSRYKEPTGIKDEKDLEAFAFRITHDQQTGEPIEPDQYQIQLVKDAANKLGYDFIQMEEKGEQRGRGFLEFLTPDIPPRKVWKLVRKGQTPRGQATHRYVPGKGLIEIGR